MLPYAVSMPRKQPPEPTPQPDEQPTPALSVEDMLVAMSKKAFPEGAMCTGWVIASEWMDADGQFWTYVGTDDRNPPWRHVGLLAYTLESGAYDPSGDSDDEDDDR